METTQPVDWIFKPFEGYMVNTQFSEENTATIMDLTSKITAAFGEAVYCMPKESLHITLLDWIAPLVDYEGRDKKELFESIFESYDHAMEEIISSEKPFEVTFDTITIAPTTIFISGQDSGAFERIRNKYLDTVELLPNTKRPPTIIHSSLARFTKEINLHEIEAFIAAQNISIKQQINNFRLIHSHKEPMLEFEVLKTYPLA